MELADMPNDRKEKTNTKYDWLELFDGKSRRMSKGVDYFTSTVNFVLLARSTAKRKGVKVTVKKRGDAVYIQANLDQPK